MNNILNKYSVKFSTSKDFALSNRVETINPWLTQFIGDHYTLIEANRLLTGVRKILISNDSGNYCFDTQSLQVASVTKSLTKIYEDVDKYEENPNMIADFSLPTQDFKVIVEAWKNYLETSSLKP